MKYILVLGTTEPSDFALFDNDDPLVGTGIDVSIEFRESGVSATCDWLSEAGGTVRVTDPIGMSVRRTYHFRFKLVDGAGKIGYCPNGFSPDEWYIARTT